MDGTPWALRPRRNELPWRPCLATFSLVAAKASVGTHHNCFFAKKLALGQNSVRFSEFFRFCKIIYSQLAPWWCRRPLRGTPRTLRDAAKNDKRCPKCAWRPTGVGQKTRKGIYRHVSRSRPVIGRKSQKIDDMHI